MDLLLRFLSVILISSSLFSAGFSSGAIDYGLPLVNQGDDLLIANEVPGADFGYSIYLIEILRCTMSYNKGDLPLVIPVLGAYFGYSSYLSKTLTNTIYHSKVHQFSYFGDFGETLPLIHEDNSSSQGDDPEVLGDLGQKLCLLDEAERPEEGDELEVFGNLGENVCFAKSEGEDVLEESLPLPIPTDGNWISGQDDRKEEMVIGLRSIRYGAFIGTHPHSNPDESRDGTEAEGGGSGGGDGGEPLGPSPSLRVKKIDVYWVEEGNKYQLDSVVIDVLTFGFAGYVKTDFENSVKRWVSLKDNNDLVVQTVMRMPNAPWPEIESVLTLSNRNITFEYYYIPTVTGPRGLVDPDTYLMSFLLKVDFLILRAA